MESDNEWDILKTELPRWIDAAIPFTLQGKVASYIPELSKASPNALGIDIVNTEGERISAGDASQPFTLQSISKVFTLLLALMDHGENKVFEKVGMEPTGDKFDSMLKLELVQPGIPFNPLINAGAIVVSSMVKGSTQEEKSARILQFIRTLAANPDLNYDMPVYRSEAESADLNRAIAYILKDNRVITGNVDEILDIYFRQCSILVSCTELARMALVLACNGFDPILKKQLVPKRYVQIAKTFMITCGMYDASGEFAIQVGLPAKSGVSGGVLSLLPNRYGIGVLGPSLNAKGNSIAGVHLLKMISKERNWSIF